MDSVLKVNRIFTSVQGESNLQGFPCVFVRLYGCNLNCSYCDTIQDKDDFILLTANQVYQEIKEEKLKTKFVCITGGEPLLQIENMKWLLNKLSEDDYIVNIETNGAVKIPDWANLDNVNYIIDVKCPSSGQKVDWDIFAANLRIITLPNTEIKFVVANHKDFYFAYETMEKLTSACQNYLYSMYGEYIPFNPTFIFSPVMDKNFAVTSFTFANWVARQLVRSRMNAKIQLQLHKLIGVE